MNGVPVNALWVEWLLNEFAGDRGTVALPRFEKAFADLKWVKIRQNIGSGIIPGPWVRLLLDEIVPVVDLSAVNDHRGGMAPR